MLAGAAVVAMAGFAFVGGEYGTPNLLSLQRQVRDQKAAISALRHEVDSLQREERLLRTDPATQERAARELYGMIREGEILYQVVPRDTGR